MDKIDNTFIERRAAQILADTYDEDMEATDMFEQSVDLGRFAIEVVEGALEEYGVNFDYTENPELKGDMFVILNLMVSTLLRDAGIKHVLQEEMELLKDRIMEMEKHTDDIT